MSSATTSPATPDSTLRLTVQPATASTSPPPVAGTPSKRIVRAKAPALTAVRLVADQVVRLADGRETPAHPGDWLITNGRVVVDLVGETQLAVRYAADEGGGRLLPLAICDRLERTTGIGSTRTPEDLVKAVERLAAIHIGTIQIDFTPGQLEEIAHRAKKRGWTIEQSLRAVVDRIKEEIFWRG